jgi:hypothetical protein
MKDTGYSKLFGLSLAAVLAFVLALNALALSNVTPQNKDSPFDLRAGDSAAERR